MVEPKSPHVSLWQATRLISRSFKSRGEHGGFTTAAAQLRRVLHEGAITAIADFCVGPLGWTPENTVPGGPAEFDFDHVVCPGAAYERREVPAVMWDETAILWKQSLVWQPTRKGVEIYKMVRISIADLKPLWPETVPEQRAKDSFADPELRPAPPIKIHAAITEVYDEKHREKAKPPNIRQIAEPVLRILKEQGYKASGIQVQHLAAEAQHAARRRKSGKTLASERARPVP